jgi:mannose-1-phosphate guanylyltransferase/mannose-6-phosphate isomerase
MTESCALVLAGGRGERFWPWSRPERPKQLLPLASGGRTLLAATLDRALMLAPASRVLVLTAQDLRGAVERECAGRGVRVLGEPMMRNTAAAIAAAAVVFGAESKDPAFAVLPADHAIDDVLGFARDLDRGLGIAKREAVLVTVGIRAAHPETNFGYIRRGARLADRLYRVDRFTEKPDRERAEAWVKGGEHLWNCGIFAWRCSTFMQALAASRPDLAAPFEGLRWEGDAARFERDLHPVFAAIEPVSVDYAVLEKAPNVLMIEASFDWDDLGSWGAWARRQPRDAAGNVVHGDALAIDCRDCVVVGEGGTAAAVGLERMVVVHASGATLAVRLDQAEHARKAAEAQRNRTAAAPVEKA